MNQSFKSIVLTGILNSQCLIEIQAKHAQYRFGINNDPIIKYIDVKYQGLIKDALVCYSSDQDMILNHSLALEYCKYMNNNEEKQQLITFKTN